MAKHDAAWKLLFSFPEMVRDLLAGFVPPGWVSDLDLSALVREPESRIGEDLSERLQDRVWRVRIRGQPRVVLVLLEFQSTVDRTMALRMLDYTADMYRDLLRESRPRRLPAVLPIVLYHGKRPWRAREEVAELADPPTAFRAPYQPSQRYFLLDVGGYAGPLPQEPNLMAELIRLAHADSEDTVMAILTALATGPSSSDRVDLLRAFGVWYEQARKRHGLPEVQWPVPDELNEGETMPNELMTQRVNEWKERQIEKWTAPRVERSRMEGRTEGRMEGRVEGRTEGQAEVVRRQAARKFGAETAERLAGRLADVTDPERTAEVGEWLLECESGEELLARVEGLCESSANGDGARSG